MAFSKQEVDRVVSERISPVVGVDGGSVEVVKVDEAARAVALRFGGSYRGSPCRGIVLEYVVRPIFAECFSEAVQVDPVD